jgi:hypothetical protein
LFRMTWCRTDKHFLSITKQATMHTMPETLPFSYWNCIERNTKAKYHDWNVSTCSFAMSQRKKNSFHWLFQKFTPGKPHAFVVLHRSKYFHRFSYFYIVVISWVDMPQNPKPSCLVSLAFRFRLKSIATRQNCMNISVG